MAESPTVAGIAVRARDTGRILMLQRSIADTSDPARGKWEFPGGHLEPGEHPFAGAKREWQEESGVPLPDGEQTGSWRTGPYLGHVYVVPSEDDIPLHLGADQRPHGNPDDPDGDDIETLAWLPPTEARAMPGLRPELNGADWTPIHQAVPDGVFKRDTRAVVTLRRRVSLRKAGYPQLVRAHVRGGSLTPEVDAELKHYFATRPDTRAREAAEHGFDPVTDPARYLASERAEGYHKSLAGPIDLAAVQAWEREEDARGYVGKEQPAASDVHVDTATWPSGKKKRKPPVDDETAEVEAEPLAVKVVKADDEQRIVYGIVLEPAVEDSQGDVVSKDDVELAAHRFLYRGGPIGVQHRTMAPESVRPVESYVAPCDFVLNGQPVRKGSWVLAAHVPDEGLWRQVRKGEKTAWSVGGFGRRAPL